MSQLASHRQDWPNWQDGQDTLDSAGEAEWQRLRQQLELATGFWLGFVFCPSPRTVASLRWRTAQILRFRALPMQLIRPATPEDFHAVLPQLFEPHSAQLHCLWIEAIQSDSPTLKGDQSGPWTTAWDEFLLRLNERRDALRRHLVGGVVLAAPPAIKPRVRNAAPDLWSIRSLVLEIQPSSRKPNGTADLEPQRSLREVLSEITADSTLGAIDVDFALAEARRIEDKRDFQPQTLSRVLFRVIEGFLERGQTHDATATAHKTVNLLRDQPHQQNLLADALAWLSQAERADNDMAACLAHLEEEIRLRRRLLDTLGQTPQAVRDLSVSLNKLGDVRRETGDLPAATAAYEESLALARRLLDTLGHTPQAVRDLSVSLDNLGNVRREAGDLPAATAAYEESLALARRLLDTLGQTPQAVRDLSVSLNKLGDVRRETGDLPAATAAYEESLALRRANLQRYNQPPPQAFRDLLISLGKMEDVLDQNGNQTALAALRQERQDVENQLASLNNNAPNS